MVIRFPKGLVVMPSDKVNKGESGYLCSIDQLTGMAAHETDCGSAKAAYTGSKAGAMWYYVKSWDDVETLRRIVNEDKLHKHTCLRNI